MLFPYEKLFKENDFRNNITKNGFFKVNLILLVFKH